MKKCYCCGVKEGEYHKETCERTDGSPFSFIYLSRPIFCARCGKENPEHIMFPDKVWELIIGKTYSKEDVLCEDCILFIIDVRSKEYINIFHELNKYID